MAVPYGKVEICGVDTATLPVLKEKDKERLLLQVKKGDQAARNELIQGNLRLVLSVIKRFNGLMKAIDHFDITQQVRFSTYAVPMIIGEIRRYLRDNNAIRVSRSIKDMAYRAMQTKEKLTAKLNREPTVSEIAEDLKVPRGEVVLALESIVEPLSLYEPVFSDGGDAIYVLDQVGDKNDDRCWLDEISFKETVKSLSPREKQIMTLRFLDGKTQMEVSKEIGISQAQVSRLEKGVIEKIKKDS